MKRHSIRTPHITQANATQWLIPALSSLVVALLVVALVAYFYPGEPEPGPCTTTTPEVRNTDQDHIDALQKQIARLEKERDKYRLQSAQYERASQIDQKAVSTVQADLKKLQEERAELRRQVEFLKSLVSGDITSLQLIDFKIEKTDEKHTYSYTLKVSKRAKGQDKVQGSLVFHVVGKKAGKTTKLREKDLRLTGTRRTMNFQNFQNYKGTFTLPDGFTAKTFRIAVKPKGDKFKSFEKDFPWSLITQ